VSVYAGIATGVTTEVIEAWSSIKTAVPGLTNARLTPSYRCDHTSTTRRDGDATTNKSAGQPGCTPGSTPLAGRAGHTAPETTEHVFQREPKARHLAGDTLVKIRVGLPGAEVRRQVKHAGGQVGSQEACLGAAI
jgi:hypothetical protein